MKTTTIIGIGIVATGGVLGFLYYRGKRVQAAQGTTQTTSGQPAPSSVVDTIAGGLKALGDSLGMASTTLDAFGQPIIGHYESPTTFAQRAVSGQYTK